MISDSFDEAEAFELNNLPFDRYAHKNPAFAAVLIHGVAAGYAARKVKGIAVPWAMLSIPYLAAESIRTRIPKSYNASLSILLDKHPAWQAQNAEALRGAAKFFWPAMRLGVARGILTLQDGRVRTIGPLNEAGLSDLDSIYAVAEKLGRFLAKESEETLPSLFNIEVVQ